MIGNKRHRIVEIIGRDLLYHGKLPLVLLMAVLGSAVLVVTTTHQTRLLTAEREQMLLEKDALDIEWRNLILEENVLGDHNRIESIATEKLKMRHIDLLKENIMVQY